MSVIEETDAAPTPEAGHALRAALVAAVETGREARDALAAARSAIAGTSDRTPCEVVERLQRELVAAYERVDASLQGLWATARAWAGAAMGTQSDLLSWQVTAVGQIVEAARGDVARAESDLKSLRAKFAAARERHRAAERAVRSAAITLLWSGLSLRGDVSPRAEGQLKRFERTPPAPDSVDIQTVLNAVEELGEPAPGVPLAIVQAYEGSKTEYAAAKSDMAAARDAVCARREDIEGLAQTIYAYTSEYSGLVGLPCPYDRGQAQWKGERSRY